MDPNLRRQTLADTLRRSAARYPERLGLICGATRWTYSEFHALSERLAAGLAARGIHRGDRVAIHARNSHGFAALRYALMRLAVVSLKSAAQARITCHNACRLRPTAKATKAVIISSAPATSRSRAILLPRAT